MASFVAAIRGHRRAPVAAMGVAGLAERVIAEKARLAPLVTRTAAPISRRLRFAGSS